MIRLPAVPSHGLSWRLFAALCLIGASGCGEDPAGPGPSMIPDLVGTYLGSWQTGVSLVATGAELVVTCPGSVIVAEQDADGGFSGFWTQVGTTECSAASGSLAGSVAAGGAVAVTELVNASGRTFEESSGCVVASGDDTYTGTADDTRFEIARIVTADCPSNELTIEWRLDATR